MASEVDERALDKRLAALEAARAWSPRVVSRLEALLRDDDEAALFRVNPFTWASRREVADDEALDLFLHATALGLFEMDWLLICPRCACAVASFARLRAVMRRYRCPDCRNEYEAAMDDFIAIYFTVSPAVRTIRYHDPATLDPFDYLYGFKTVREGWTPDGRPFVEAVRAALRGVAFLEPRTTTVFRLAATAGVIAGGGSDNEAGFELEIDERAATEPQLVRLAYFGGAYRPDRGRVARGPLVLAVENPTDDRVALALLEVPPDHADTMLRFEPYLTGKHLLTSQTFRSLFRSEVVGGAQGLAIRDIALLFTDIKGSTALYQRIGDLNAYQLVQQHFDWLREATVRHGGAVVKTIGDAVMAAYPDAVHAVAAALDMRAAVERCRREAPDRAMSLKIGVHHGAAIAVTLNGELDYFGQTVNIAARVQATADAGEICVTDEVWRYPGVQACLAACPAAPGTAAFAGVGRPMGVVRIGPPGTAAPA